MKKNVNIKQHDQNDCGAACLASVMEFYGLSMSISRIRQLTGTDKRGTNVLGLVEAAEKLGFSCKGVKAVDNNGHLQKDVIGKIPKPTIVHVFNNENMPHFVVIYKIKNNNVYIMDPAYGEIRKINIESFINKTSGILVILVPNEDFTAINDKTSTILRFWFLFKPHSSVFVQALVGALVYTVLGVVSSICVQKIVDFVIPNGNRNLLNILCLCMVLSTILASYLNYMKSLLIIRTGVIINTRLILGYYKYILKLPQSFFDNMRSGELISRIADATQINNFISYTLINIIVNIFTIIVAFALMFSYYWKLAAIMLVSIPIYGLIFIVYNIMNKKFQRAQMEDAAELEVQLVESLKSSLTIKMFALETYFNQKTEGKFLKLTQTAWKSGITSLTTDTTSNAFSSLFTTILLWMGTTYVLDGIISPGELMSFHTLTSFFIAPVISLVGTNRTYQNARIASDRLFEIFDLETEERKTESFANNITNGDIIFDNVTFRYGTRENVFSSLNIVFKEKQVNAIVGESGSGKTSIASLIQKLYPIQEGHIYIGDKDIRYYNTTDLRKTIGVVPQRIDLFNGTIIDNIILDDINPDWNYLYEICKKTGICDFTDKMQLGLKTMIGENGAQLSGGQRQRIAIARALYKKPKIIIFDEATSALDSKSENKIKEIIRDLKEQNCTIILIAHRLGTIMEADTIFVLENGAVVESGSHEELLKQNGLYVKYWFSQTQGCNE